MTVTCPKCKTKLNIPDAKIKPGGIRVKCLKCGASLVYRGRNKTGSAEKPPGTKPAAPSTEQSNSKSQTAASGEIKPQVKTGDTETEGTAPEAEGPSSEDAARAEEMHKRYGFMSAEKERLELKPFLEYLPDVITFPFKGGGLLMLSIGTVCFTVLLLFSKFAMIFGFIGFIFVGGYLSSFMMKIVSYSADGEIELPDWPDFSDWWDDIIVPMFQIVMVTMVSYFPLIIYLIFLASVSISSIVIIPLLVIVGTLYQPMALISISMNRSVKALNPLVLIPAIAKVPLDYAVACGVLLLLFIFKGIFNFLVFIPILGPLLDNFIMLYLLVVEMRILGLLYYANQEKFGWF